MEEKEYDSNEDDESDTISELSNDGDSDSEEYKLKYSFARACWQNDVEKIRELAPHFDLKTIRFKAYCHRPDPLELCINDKGETKGIETLLELGAEVTPNYAYRIRGLLTHEAPESYIKYFKDKGYDLYELSDKAENPYYLTERELEYNRQRAREYELKEACVKRDLDKIRELAPVVDLNDTLIGGRYRGHYEELSLLFWSLSPTGETDAVELLMSLGATLTPRDAYYIMGLIDRNLLPSSYLDFFKDLKKFDEEYCERERRKK